MRMLVVVPVYNRPELLWRCLWSVANQTDDAFDVIVTDDASTDPKVAEYMDDWCASGSDRGTWWSRWAPENVGATRNIAEAIRSVDMHPDDAVFIVDGDDYLSDPDALATYRSVYEAPGALAQVVYGSYHPEPPDPMCPPARPIPLDVLRDGSIRAWATENGMPWNHPLSFRRRIFDALSDDDFQIDGEWMRYGYDVTFMAPMVELAGVGVVHCPDDVYAYSAGRPESVARLVPDDVRRENGHVLGQPRKYEPLP